MENNETSPAYASGPWETKIDPYGTDEWWLYDSEGQFLASVYCCVAETDGLTVDREKTEATARLIAAAPELLEAVKDALESIEDFYKIETAMAGQHFGRALVERMQTAIAKAEGGHEEFLSTGTERG
jgi:hypothetical protein